MSDKPILLVNIHSGTSHYVLVDFSHIKMIEAPIRTKRVLIELAVFAFNQRDPYRWIMGSPYRSPYSLHCFLEPEVHGLIRDILTMGKPFKHMIVSIVELLSVSIPAGCDLGVVGWDGPLIATLWVDS